MSTGTCQRINIARYHLSIWNNLCDLVSYYNPSFLSLISLEQYQSILHNIPTTLGPLLRGYFSNCQTIASFLSSIRLFVTVANQDGYISLLSLCAFSKILSAHELVFQKCFFNFSFRWLSFLFSLTLKYHSGVQCTLGLFSRVCIFLTSVHFA